MNDQRLLYCHKCGVGKDLNHERHCWFVRDVPYPYRKKVLTPCCDPPMRQDNPQRLACRCCDAALGLVHIGQCPYRFAGLHVPRTVLNTQCNYDDEYKLPDVFRDKLSMTHYCQIGRALRQAKDTINDIQTLCVDNDIKIPS